MHFSKLAALLLINAAFIAAMPVQNGNDMVLQARGLERRGGNSSKGLLSSKKKKKEEAERTPTLSDNARGRTVPAKAPPPIRKDSTYVPNKPKKPPAKYSSALEDMEQVRKS
ncbi:hypothetical protein C8J56DRAFT_940178 [Mycena floridula]|nr:hypothetical protein C8J56DRAFT_940178 [Mycena floridula]